MVRIVVLCVLSLAFSNAVSASGKILTPELAKVWDLKPESFTCPLTGKRFKQVVTHPHYPIESFPDSSHLGDEWIDTQIPECPEDRVPILPDYVATEASEDAGSGRLTYQSYTEEELARIPALIASDEWAALLDDTRHLRAYWLAKQLGRPALDRANLVLHSPWGAETEEQRKAALEALVADIPGILDELDAGEEVTYYTKYIVVDALRQLGRFDEALAMIEDIEGIPPADLLTPDPDNRLYQRDDIAARMANTVSQGVTDRFAISLLTDRMAGRFCSNPEEYAEITGPAAARQCAERAALQDRQQAALDAGFELREDLEALDSACSTTAVADRSDALYSACEGRAYEVATAEAERMEAEEPARIVDLCQGRDVARETSATFFACIRYNSALESVVGRILTRDDAAYASLCVPDPITYEEDEAIAMACSSARESRAEIGAEALWQNFPALRKYCKESDLEGRTLAQIKACVDVRYYDEKNPPTFYAREERDGELYYDELTRLAVPNAQALVAEWMAKRGA